MKEFNDWILESQLVNESFTSGQTVLKLKAALAARGHDVAKHIDRGEHGQHVIYHHDAAKGDRYKTIVKGDTTTSRPARPNEATHFAPKVDASIAAPKKPVKAPEKKPEVKKPAPVKKPEAKK